MRDQTQRNTVLLGLAGLVLVTSAASAQRVIPQPVTDASAQASPLNRVTGEPISDAAAQASPIDVGRAGNGIYIAPHTPIAVELTESIDSGFLKQGQDVKAHLSAPLQIHGGATLPAGTPVQLSVIASAPAGRMMSVGEFSLQILRVGKINVYTNTLVFDGKPGRQDLPDSNPELGTDAGLPSGSTLTFHVLPAPSDDVNILGGDAGPGSVHAIAPGGLPPASQLHSTYTDPVAVNPESGKNQSQFVSPANTTTNQQIQHLGQASPAPNQMASPAQTGSTTPR